MCRFASVLFVATFRVIHCGDVTAEDALPVVLEEDFENGVKHWEPTDLKAGQVYRNMLVQRLRLYRNQSQGNYDP